MHIAVGAAILLLMAKSITVRHVPDEVRDELAARAAKEGQSLQEFVLAQLRRIAATPSMGDVVAGMRERTRVTGTRISADEILKLRDADRR
jgi:hypothetical protein